MNEISAIISVRNGEPFIAETIKSLLDQGDCLREIVVVNDHSTDQTEEVVQSFDNPRVKLVQAKRKGLPAGRNCGVEVATGEWLYFIDADDLVTPGSLQKLLDTADNNPKSGFIYADYDRISHDGTKRGLRHRLLRHRTKPSGDVLPHILRGNITVVGAQIVKRSVYDSAGPFNEDLKVSDDWDFWCRAAAVTPFTFVPDLFVMNYRVHDSSIIHSKPLPFSAFEPGINSVFSYPVIKSRFSAEELQRLRRACETSKMTYIAVTAVRLRHFRTAFSTYLKSLFRSPMHGHKTTLRFAGAFFKL